MNIDLRDPSFAYFFGFIQADGSMSHESRGRGRLTIELNSKDNSILEHFKNIVPCSSGLYTWLRDTNLKNGYKASVFRVYNQEFRKQLVQLGIHYGRKSATIAPPTCLFSEVDYFRGYIDGDGSIGLTSNGFPFLSIITSSPDFVDAYLKFVYKVTGKQKTSSPNKRDRVHNIAVFKEDAQAMAYVLYYDKCLALPRKLEKAKEVLAWERPKSMKKIDNRKRWTPQEDEYILSHGIDESVKHLKRTRSSVSLRLWRIRNSNK